MRPAPRPRYARSPLQQPRGGSAARRHVLPVPATAQELDDQLRQILPHASTCWWNTHPVRRAGEPLADTERARCTCTAVPHRQHLVDVVRAAAIGQLPGDVATAGAQKPAGDRS